jgi:hypothetical protein
MVPVHAILNSARTGKFHLALSTYRYVPSCIQQYRYPDILHPECTGTYHVTQVVRTGTCYLALRRYMYVPSGTQHVPVRVMWHSERTCTWPSCTQNVSVRTSGTRHVPVRVILNPERAGTCHLALRWYAPPGTQHIPYQRYVRYVPYSAQ